MNKSGEINLVSKNALLFIRMEFCPVPVSGWGIPQNELIIFD